MARSVDTDNSSPHQKWAQQNVSQNKIEMYLQRQITLTEPIAGTKHGLDI